MVDEPDVEHPGSAEVTAGPCGCCDDHAAPQSPADCCHYKATPRDEEFQADLQRRLNRVIGQLNGVKAMLDDNRYCGDVLTQLAASQSALKGISSLLLRDHLETCVVQRIEQGDTEVMDEVMQLIRRFS